jgi:D-tyrosyl-tRNA(Tyr) deacylase
MIAVVQRVSEASVTVDGEVVGRIGPGLAVLAAVHRTDTVTDITWTANKLVGLRIFRNGDKYFDADVKQVGGSILLVSNFTVAAATREGRRPSFIAAAETGRGREVFDELVKAVRATGVSVETGRFGADMLVSIVNDGPVTVIVDSRSGPLSPVRGGEG